MKQKLLAISVLYSLSLIVSCVQQQSKTISAEDRISEVDPESVGLLDGSDTPLFDPYSCDSNFIYGNLEICSEANTDHNGNVISVVNNGNNTGFKLCEFYGCFFKGMLEEKLIVDAGTGSLRELEIYDLGGEKVFSGNYINELRLRDGSVIYWTLSEALNLNEKPPCAENWEGDRDVLGFIEQFSLNLSTLELRKSGKTDCQLLE